MLRRWEALDVPGSSRGSFAMGPRWSMERQTSAEQVLQWVGSPDHVRQSTEPSGKKYRGTEDWEYDLRVADQWVTLRLTWEAQSPRSRMIALQEESATWLESEQRVLELHDR